MVNSLKRINKIQIIGLISLTISFVLYLFNINIAKYLFWVCLAITMLGYLLFVAKWSKEGRTNFRKLDKDYNKNFTRKSSEYIFMMVVAYFIVICGSVIVSIFIKDFMYDFGTTLGLYSISIICNIVSLMIVDRTSKEVDLLIKGGKK